MSAWVEDELDELNVYVDTDTKQEEGEHDDYSDTDTKQEALEGDTKRTVTVQLEPSRQAAGSGRPVSAVSLLFSTVSLLSISSAVWGFFVSILSNSPEGALPLFGFD